MIGKTNKINVSFKNWWKTRYRGITRSDPNNQTVIGRQFKARRRFNSGSDRQQETREQRLGNTLGSDVSCREARNFGARLAVGGDRGNKQGGFDGGTVGISRELRLGKRRPWNLRPGNRGTVEAWVDAVGNRGELPWKSGGEPGDGRQDWSWRAGTSEGNDCGKMMRENKHTFT